MSEVRTACRVKLLDGRRWGGRSFVRGRRLRARFVVGAHHSGDVKTRRAAIGSVSLPATEIWPVLSRWYFRAWWIRIMNISASYECCGNSGLRPWVALQHGTVVQHRCSRMICDSLLSAVSWDTKRKDKSYGKQGSNNSSLEKHRGDGWGIVFFSCLGPDYYVGGLGKEAAV